MILFMGETNYFLFRKENLISFKLWYLLLNNKDEILMAKQSNKGYQFLQVSCDTIYEFNYSNNAIKALTI